MTDKEKEYLMDLFEKHELSLDTVMCLLGIGAARAAMHAIDSGDEKLEQVMSDLDIECMRYHMGGVINDN